MKNIFLNFLRQKKSNVSISLMNDHEKTFRFVFITTLQNDEYADILIDLLRVKYKRGYSFMIGIPKYHVDNCPSLSGNKYVST